MLAFENTVNIEVSIGEVFIFVSDQRNNPKWNYYILSVEQTNTCLGAGAEYLQVRKRDRQAYRITTLILDRCCVVQTLPGARPAVRRIIHFAGDEGHTTIRDRVELGIPLPKFLSSWLTAKSRRAVRHNLNCLKTLLETGEVVLIDGRTITIDG